MGGRINMNAFFIFGVMGLGWIFVEFMSAISKKYAPMGLNILSSLSAASVAIYFLYR
jgi:hypothetical protein